MQLLQTGHYVYFAKPQDEGLFINDRLQVVSKDRELFNGCSYIVYSIRRKQTEDDRLEIEQDVSTLLGQIQGKGSSGKASIEFLNGKLEGYNKYKKLSRILEIQKKGERATAEEKDLLIKQSLNDFVKKIKEQLDFPKIKIPNTNTVLFDPMSHVEDFIRAAVGQPEGWFAKTVRHLLKQAVSYVFDTIRQIIGAADEYGKRIYAYLVENDHFGLVSAIEKALERYALERPIFEIQDPYPILEKGEHPVFPAGDLIPVKLPLEYISTQIRSNELVIEADIGN